MKFKAMEVGLSWKGKFENTRALDEGMTKGVFG